jgi:nucleotide-binding universal stress UspA family protein
LRTPTLLSVKRGINEGTLNDGGDASVPMTVAVATDGSDLAIRAACTGLSLLSPSDRIVVVAVADTVDPSLAEDATGHAAATMTHAQVESQHRDAISQGHAAVEKTVAALRETGSSSGSSLELSVIEGEPGPALCQFATDIDATTIVVGSRGLGRIKRALLGSVSDYVVRNAPCAVVVTRSPDP